MRRAHIYESPKDSRGQLVRRTSLQSTRCELASFDKRRDGDNRNPPFFGVRESAKVARQRIVLVHYVNEGGTSRIVSDSRKSRRRRAVTFVS